MSKFLISIFCWVNFFVNMTIFFSFLFFFFFGGGGG